MFRRTDGAAGGADFDVVFMDSVMPVMDGLEASRRIRAGGFDVIIVGVTGNALAEDIREFCAAGANFVLTKPVSVARLQEQLARYGLVDSDA